MSNIHFIELADENQLTFSLECQKQMAARNYVDHAHGGKPLTSGSNTMGFSDAGDMALMADGYKEIKYPSTKKGIQTEIWLIRITCDDDIAIAFGQKTNSEHAMISKHFPYGKSFEAQECFMSCIHFVEALEKYNSPRIT